MNKEQEIIKVLFKDLQNRYNSRSISKIVGMSHVGAFKILKKLEKKEIVKPERMGKAIFYSLNLKNPVARKEVERVLTIEAQDYKRWLEEFKELEDKVEFAILFGSIIKNERVARDIDISIVARQDKFNDIKSVIKERNKFSYKKIHLILQKPEEFKMDIYNKNKVMLEIIKTGVVLFGQDKIRQLICNE